MLISLTQAETTRNGTLEKEKNEIMRYHLDIHSGSQANPTVRSGSVVDRLVQTMHTDSSKQSTANGGFVY